MNRNDQLGEITGIAGDVFAELEAKGIEFPQRAVLAFCERFSKKWLKLPQDTAALDLAKSVLNDETNHGGLTSKASIQLATEIKREAG